MGLSETEFLNVFISSCAGTTQNLLVTAIMVTTKMTTAPVPTAMETGMGMVQGEITAIRDEMTNRLTCESVNSVCRHSIHSTNAPCSNPTNEPSQAHYAVAL